MTVSTSLKRSLGLWSVVALGLGYREVLGPTGPPGDTAAPPTTHAVAHAVTTDTQHEGRTES